VLVNNFFDLKNNFYSFLLSLHQPCHKFGKKNNWREKMKKTTLLSLVLANILLALDTPSIAMPARIIIPKMNDASGFFYLLGK
jgi:hypothetical protein